MEVEIVGLVRTMVPMILCSHWPRPLSLGRIWRCLGNGPQYTKDRGTSRWQDDCTTALAGWAIVGTWPAVLSYGQLWNPHGRLEMVGRAPSSVLRSLCSGHIPSDTWNYVWSCRMRLHTWWWTRRRGWHMATRFTVTLGHVAHMSLSLSAETRRQDRAPDGPWDASGGSTGARQAGFPNTITVFSCVT
jgi:hypothetical protein